MDSDKLMGLMDDGEELSTFFRAQRKLEGLLSDGILVLTNRRLLWVEETGDPIACRFGDLVGAAHHELQLALRFQDAWLALFFKQRSQAADCEKRVVKALNSTPSDSAAAAKPG